jgi:GH25 family lysozyme M1 (1,4-beta-N-acetylmuramidase)
MTLFGIDVSKQQVGLQLATVKTQGYRYVMICCTEGASHASPTYPTFLAQARQNGLLVSAYHYLRSDSSAAAQAANLARHIIDKTIPVMIDCELGSHNSRPNMAMVSAFSAALKPHGMHVGSLYYPKFWWHETGEPNLLGYHLVQALYGANPHGYGSDIYPGDDSPRWAKMGGVTPTILQFGSNGKLSGYTANTCDVDAYRGTLDQLKALRIFKDYSKPATTPPKLPERAPTAISFHFLEGSRKHHSTSVGLFQRALNAVTGARLAIDGVYGPATTAAVKAFQVKVLHDKSPDGSLSFADFTLLGHMSKTYTPKP